MSSMPQVPMQKAGGGALGSPHLQTPLCFTLPAPTAAAAKVTLKGGQPCPQLTHPEG